MTETLRRKKRSKQITKDIDHAITNLAELFNFKDFIILTDKNEDILLLAVGYSDIISAVKNLEHPDYEHWEQHTRRNIGEDYKKEMH